VSLKTYTLKISPITWKITREKEGKEKRTRKKTNKEKLRQTRKEKRKDKKKDKREATNKEYKDKRKERKQLLAEEDGNEKFIGIWFALQYLSACLLKPQLYHFRKQKKPLKHQ